MPIPFSFLHDKIRMGKKTLTYRQTFVPQIEIGKEEELCDSKNKKKVKKKSGKGYKEINPIIAKGKITHIYFRFKKDLTLEECCAEQGREIPEMPIPQKFGDYENYSYQQLLKLRENIEKNIHLVPDRKAALFAIQWQIESCLVIIKKSWRLLTKINGDKPNGIIVRWDFLCEENDPQQDLRTFQSKEGN